MTGGYEGARLGIETRRAHGAPPDGLAGVARWCWREFGIGVRDVRRWPDPSLAARWPDGLDAVALARPAAGVQGRIFYDAGAPFAREAVGRELGRLLLPEDARDQEATDFAACLLVHPGDVATALGGDWPAAWVTAHRTSAALVMRRLVLLGEWVDQAEGAIVAAHLARLGRVLPLAAGE